MQIRAATPEDREAVDTLLARAYPRLLAPDYASAVLEQALPVITKARPELLGCGTYFLIEEQGALVGAGGYATRADAAALIQGERDVADVRHVVTDDRNTRRGIGTALMQHILAEARADAIKQLMCWSTLTAVPFYTAMGFEVLGSKAVTLSGGAAFPSVEMQQML